MLLIAHSHKLANETNLAATDVCHVLVKRLDAHTGWTAAGTQYQAVLVAVTLAPDASSAQSKVPLATTLDPQTQKEYPQPVPNSLKRSIADANQANDNVASKRRSSQPSTPTLTLNPPMPFGNPVLADRAPTDQTRYENTKKATAWVVCSGGVASSPEITLQSLHEWTMEMLRDNGY